MSHLTMEKALLSALLVALLLIGTNRSAQAQPPVIPIYNIQGAGHVSPFVGQTVTTEGVVTAVGFRSYYVQDPAGDGNDATSDSLFVFDSRISATPSAGDLVRLTGSVEEFIPGGVETGNLSITRMEFPSITILTSDKPSAKPSDHRLRRPHPAQYRRDQPG